MNQQEQATRRAAIFQDTINGINDPTPWPITMWAASGDTIWTAGTASTSGVDAVGMLYDPGEIVAHRHRIVGDATRADESFTVKPAAGQNPVDAMLAAIEKWNHCHPDRWDTVTTPGDCRMTDPTTGRELPMGWSASLAAAASAAAGRLDPDLLQASLLQAAVEREPRPCVFFQEDNGYDLMVFSWHRNEQGLFDAMSFKHLQYDDLSMQVTTISHSEDMRESFPAKTMRDGDLLTQSRAYLNDYQALRERDGGPEARGMTGRVMRSGLLKPGLEQKPLLNLNDGRRAPDWNEVIDRTAVSILQDRPASPAPTPLRQEQSERNDDGAAPQERRAPSASRVWPNVWVANRLAHAYVLHAKDGRDWPKMIVGLPRGTAIDGRDLTGWATDLFMSEKNQQQKAEGRAVNLRFKPGEPVELFTGRGEERQTIQVDPQTLAQAIVDAQTRNRDAEETLDAASVDLASKTVEESWPQIDRMQRRFAEYRHTGTYKPQAALKWARRLIDRTADQDDGRWTNRQRRQAARLLVSELGGTADPTPERDDTKPQAAAGHEPAATDKATVAGSETTNETRRATEPDTTGGEQDPAAPAARRDRPETARCDEPERRRVDLKSTLERFKGRLAENLHGLAAGSSRPASNQERDRTAPTPEQGPGL